MDIGYIMVYTTEISDSLFVLLSCRTKCAVDACGTTVAHLMTARHGLTD